MCEKNNVQKHIFRKIFRKHEKSSEAKCLEALIYWWGMVVSNHRPLECESSALPLS